MSVRQLIECVPNFSEGRDMSVIKRITDAISAVEGVRLLDVDPGKATHRTVVTFVGAPEAVVEAAFHGIRTASELIDMRQHAGEHPRMGATDVCPLIPVAGISMEETVAWARKLGERVGNELKIPVYLYEDAASSPDRKNLATIRAGEYEGLADKLKDPRWQPDYGTNDFNAASGATVIGARDFLVAYNANLNTTSVRRANSVAFDVREKGRVKRTGHPITGEVVRDAQGEAVRQPGTCKAVKAIGWFIEEYGIAQISMNLTDLSKTSLHEAFEACRESARSRGLRVTGSELVGLVPLKVMLDAGRFYLKQQQRSTGIPEREIIHVAVKSMGLDELSAFDPDKKIIEYMLKDGRSDQLVTHSLQDYARVTASESPTPGGGSASAYVGALGAALGTMVANLSAHKRGWDDRWQEFSDWADQGQALTAELLALVDADTEAFNQVMAAFRMPKETDEEKAERSSRIQDATRQAIEVPLQVMRAAERTFPLLHEMVREGNPNSVSDAGVGALCARAAVHGAWLNVQINLPGLKDEAYRASCLAEGREIVERTDHSEREIIALVTGQVQS
ncbi:MAG: glutamate formimidoyltransferase [Saprospiraceae bacterium]|nr:glutamate formimidoyltransferase [Saprospiraceae bacterium]